MTHEEYLATQKRESDAVAQTSAAELFACYRIRSGVSTRFLPGEGATLHFANKATDTLRLPSIPQGFLASGDQVKVLYKGVAVFLGDVASIRRRKSKGSDDTEEVTIVGPWAKMARLVYRQNWNTASGYQLSSRLILNQHQSGTAQNLNSELTEIANHKASACGYTVGSINVSTLKLPLDECRDITIADAIRRELRLFPKVVSRFDYSGSTPALYITRPDTSNDASYIAAIPKTERTYEYNANPITGVDLEIETTGDVDGVPYRTISHQTAGNTLAGNPNCLYATLQLAGASSNTVRQSLKSVTEAIPSDLNDKTWWMAKHYRLANVAASAVTISDGARSGAATAQNYPRIAACTAGELEEAGLNCRVERFTCKATIATTDDKEEEIYLAMDFLVTNATTRTYTWTAESSSASGESVPSGLAAAILADRAGTLRSESMTIRLGSVFPQLGDAADGLLLQAFDVDLGALTASLEFGVPDYLTPEDMASLLSAFRNKSSSSSRTVRSSGKKTDKATSEVELGGIKPLNCTEFSPGVKSKTTFTSASQTSANKIVVDATGSGGDISLATGDVPSGETVAVHTLTIKGAGANGGDLEISFVSSQDAEIPQGGASLDKEFSVDGSKVADIAASANIDITQKTISPGNGISVSESNGVITIALANASGGATSGFTGSRTVIGGVRYVTSSHTLQYKPITETWVNGVMTASSEGSWTTFHTAVEETY